MILLNPVFQILVGPMVHGFAEFSPECSLAYSVALG
jgi:hypothetical protein